MTTEPLRASLPASQIEPITPLELAAGWVFGTGEYPVPAYRRSSIDEVVALLEGAIARARGDRPCFVSFSGGRDSSVVLAAALRSARREGLPPPVALTDVYPYAPDSEESDWQEAVIRHLGVQDWIRREADDDADLISPGAQRVLRRFGVMWPAAAHVHHGLYTAAAGGVLLTGEGGDNVFGDQRITPLRVLAKRRRPSRSQLVRAASAAAPRWYRHRSTARGAFDGLPWLRPEARAEVARRLGDDVAAIPLHWYAAMLRSISGRSALVGLHNLGVVAADAGTDLVHPLRDPAFLGAIGPLTGRWGHPDRGSLMRTLFSDLLPGDILTRKSKATFNGAFFADQSREFVRSWDGSGVPEDLVDAEALRQEWLAEDDVHAMTFMLLQTAWLAADRSASSTAGER